MEFGKRPPQEEVARNLARALDLDEKALLEWAKTRHEPRSREAVVAAKEAFDERLESIAARVEYGRRPSGPLVRPGSPKSGDIPVYEAGADPADKSALPVQYLRREIVRSVIRLVRPIAYRVHEDNVRRLDRVRFPPGYAIISRAPVTALDPREPYAVRFRGRVELAYVLWDGRTLMLSPPAGAARSESVEVRGGAGLRRIVVGQVMIGGRTP